MTSKKLGERLQNGPKNGNLPDVSSITGSQNIVIPRRDFVRFRNTYSLLTHFAALVCNYNVQDLTEFHLLAPFLRATETTE